MDSHLTAIGLAAVVFVATDIDDLFILSAFFADRHLRPRAVVLGQFLGIGALTAISAAAAVVALAIPPRWWRSRVSRRSIPVAPAV